MPAARNRADFTRDSRIGIGQGRFDTRKPGGNQGVDARRRAAMVGTGLERHPGSGAAHVVTSRHGVTQRHHFGVRATGFLRVSLAQGGQRER